MLQCVYSVIDRRTSLILIRATIRLEYGKTYSKGNKLSNLYVLTLLRLRHML